VGHAEENVAQTSVRTKFIRAHATVLGGPTVKLDGRKPVSASTSSADPRQEIVERFGNT
jgi:hypothetical protein